MTARDERLRPVHRDINLTTLEVTDTPVTDEEWDAIEARRIDVQTQRERKQREDEEFVRSVREHPDPVVQEIARRYGLLEEY